MKYIKHCSGDGQCRTVIPGRKGTDEMSPAITRVSWRHGLHQGAWKRNFNREQPFAESRGGGGQNSESEAPGGCGAV